MKYLVTSALPYANAPLHLGYILEAVQTDIWVRSQRILGNHCIYLCASDAHGTPIMMKAEEENISPEKLVDKYMKEHKKTLESFRSVMIVIIKRIVKKIKNTASLFTILLWKMATFQNKILNNSTMKKKNYF